MSWFTKTVEVEKVVTLLGDPQPVTLYRAYKTEWMPALYTSFPYMKVLGYFLSCEQAFAEHPSADVDKIEAWKVGKTYVTSLKVAEVKVHPKPKRGKGKA
jgi:hypothetical protein